MDKDIEKTINDFYANYQTKKDEVIKIENKHKKNNYIMVKDENDL